MELTHFNEQGRARMVDVSEKAQTFRVARAEATVRMAKTTMDKIKEGGIGKGDVLAVAQVAGIMAAKKNSELIPMCHPLLLTKVDISFSIEDTALHILSEVRCHGETGVEMEALTAVSVAEAFDGGRVVEQLRRFFLNGHLCDQRSRFLRGACIIPRAVLSVVHAYAPFSV